MTSYYIYILLCMANFYSIADCVWNLPNSSDGKCVVTIKNNITYKGKSLTYSHDSKNKYCAYLGIRYAKPPLYKLRFRAPRTVYYPHNSVIDAKKLGPVCMQRKGTKIIGRENCLYLNIYTPIKKRRKLYPVMFWIHGGLFNSGSGNYDSHGPDYLVRQGVILVTINYRLGVFGFLYAPQYLILGNMGLKDQKFALQWVDENIKYFGGDNTNITIFGESAGAASIHHLLMDKTAYYLFQRAIMQSGSALNPWAIQINPKNRSSTLIEKLNVKKEYHLTYTLSGQTILRAALDEVPTEIDRIRSTDLVFVPIMTSNIVRRMQYGEFQDKDIIIGFNDGEGLLALDRVDKYKNEINDTLNDIRRVIPLGSYSPLNTTYKNKSIDDLSEYYNAIHLFSQKYEAYIQLMGDAWFLHGIHRMLKNIFYRRDIRYGNIYVYKLADDSYSVYKTYEFKDQEKKNLPGVCHTDDLGYIFAMSKEFKSFRYIRHVAIPKIAQKTHKKMVRMWTNFAKFGDPLKCEKNVSTLHGITWDPYNSTNEKYLVMGHDSFRMENIYEEERMELWDDVYKKEKKSNKNINNDYED